MKRITILNFSGRDSGNCASISSKIETFFYNLKICSFHIDRTYLSCGGAIMNALSPMKAVQM